MSNISTGGECIDPDFQIDEDFGDIPPTEEELAQQQFEAERAKQLEKVEDAEILPPETEEGGEETPENAPEEGEGDDQGAEAPESSSSDLKEARPMIGGTEGQQVSASDLSSEKPDSPDLDFFAPIWMTIYRPGRRTYTEIFEGEDAEKRARDFAKEKATSSGNPVAVFGPQASVYQLPKQIVAEEVDLPFKI